VSTTRSILDEFMPLAESIAALGESVQPTGTGTVRIDMKKILVAYYEQQAALAAAVLRAEAAQIDLTDALDGCRQMYESELDALRQRAEAAEAERDDARIELSLANAQRGVLAAENVALLAERDALRTDAARYRWLRDRFFGVNWDYELDDFDTMEALVFMMPEGISVSANLDATLDAALSVSPALAVQP
jgi:multidrug efflux pump subunit AcrA (membrane-fusion protein)